MWTFYAFAGVTGCLVGIQILLSLLEFRWGPFLTLLGFGVIGFLGFGWYIIAHLYFR